jgi:hypothetical protein
MMITTYFKPVIKSHSENLLLNSLDTLFMRIATVNSLIYAYIYTLYFTHSLLNNAVSSWGIRIVSNCRIRNDVEEEVSAWFEVLYWHLPGGTEVNHKNFSQDTNCPDRNLNPGPLEHDAEVVLDGDVRGIVMVCDCLTCSVTEPRQYIGSKEQTSQYGATSREV